MDKSLYDNIYQVEATHWWYKARREIIFDWVFRALKKYENPRILDIGCGTGFNISYLKQAGHERVDGVDISRDALAYCQSRQLDDIMLSSAESLPIHNSTYDVVLALDIIEHLPNDRQALSEIHRVLKTNGTFVIFVPAYKFLWSFQDEISHHQRRYEANDLRTKLDQAGLKIEKLTYINSFLFPIVFIGRLALRLFPSFFNITSESQMNPTWTNGILYQIFKSEMFYARRMNFPFGVSILCVCTKDK
ncbi:MAG: class I SAM-dependent methyltransferase [Chloroflexi bacterium]|nr:class I SAM-dependent methyltransferase [Chloroflexota bacterium]